MCHVRIENYCILCRQTLPTWTPDGYGDKGPREFHSTTYPPDPGEDWEMSDVCGKPSLVIWLERKASW